MDELEQHVRLTDSAQRGKGEILLTYHLSLLYKMRIELLDPKVKTSHTHIRTNLCFWFFKYPPLSLPLPYPLQWREQKQRALDKNKEKNLLDNDQVSVNLKNLAEYRPDIFGGDATEAAKKVI